MIGISGADGVEIHMATANPFTAKTSDDVQNASFNFDADPVQINPNKIIPVADVHGDAVDVERAENRMSVSFHQDATVTSAPSADKSDDFFNENGDLEDGRGISKADETKNNKGRRTEDVQDAKRRSVIVTGTQLFRYLYSLGLLVFSVIIVMAALFTGQTAAAEKNIPPIGAFFIFWFLIIWLAMVRKEWDLVLGGGIIFDECIYAIRNLLAICRDISTSNSTSTHFMYLKIFLPRNHRLRAVKVLSSVFSPSTSQSMPKVTRRRTSVRL